MKEKGCKKYSEIVDAFVEYRKTYYESITSIFFNNLCWLFLGTPMEEAILEDDSDRTQEKGIEEEYRLTNEVLIRIKKNVKTIQNNLVKSTSQEILG